MIDVTQDIHSLTTFKRNSSGLMKHMRKTGRPLVLTINGKPEAVLLDPTRCPLARESVSCDEAIRELLFGTGNRGTYRILFTVIGKSVYILHVRHGSMLPLNPEEE